MATDLPVMMEVRHLARGRGPVRSRLLQSAMFPEGFPFTMDYEPWNRPDRTYDVQLRRLKPRTKWETVATVYPPR